MGEAHVTIQWTIVPLLARVPIVYYWQRTASHVWCESQNEKTELMWLDFLGRVERVWAQPFAIAWGVEHRPRVYHVPDFLGMEPSGRLILFDVRSADQIEEKDLAQFEATAVVSDRLGWRYEVLTGQDPLATASLEWFKASRHERCRPPAEVTELVLGHAREGATRTELCRVAAPDCPARACSWVDCLVWHGRLTLNLAARLSNHTVFTTVAL